MKRKMIWILGILAAGTVVLLIASCSYNTHARRVLHERLETAPREPGTNILAGAAPVNIDHDRERVCVLLHGFMSSPADYGRLPEALEEAGWDVRVPLHPGHGRDPRRLRDIEADDLIEAAEEELLTLRKRYETVALGGFSMGGSIAIILAARHKPDATLLVNPFLRNPYHLKYILPLRWWHTLLSPLLDYGKHPGTIPINRPEGKDGFVIYHVVPAPIFAELFELADRAGQTDLPDVPVLALLSEGDVTASAHAARKYLHRTGGEKTQIKTYDRSNHVLMLDYDREEATRDIIGFLEDAAANQ